MWLGLWNWLLLIFLCFSLPLVLDSDLMEGAEYFNTALLVVGHADSNSSYSSC